MYNVQTTVSLIKALAKAKKVSIGKMLTDCNLNKNTLSSMQSRGSWPQANSLAKISDYLDCSMDYLMGRNMSKNQHIVIGDSNIQAVNGSSVTYTPCNSTDEEEVLKLYRSLSKAEQHRFIAHLYDIIEEKQK